MKKIILLLIFIYTPLNAVPPCPKILKSIKDFRWPPPYSIAFTEPTGRNIVPNQLYFPGSKEKLLIVLAEFSDCKFSDLSAVNKTYGTGPDKNYYARLIFGGDFISFKKDIKYSKKYNSVKRYFNEISYNQCELFGNIVRITLDKPGNYYSEDSSIEVDNANISFTRILKDTALKLQKQGVDITSYDYDQDGYIDHLIVITAASNQSAYNQTEEIKESCIWPKRVLFTDNGLTLKNKKKLGWGVVLTFDSPVGVIAHELFHELGASDLYDPDMGHHSLIDDNTFPVSFWGLMDAGAWNHKEGESPGECPAHPLGFFKWKMGWIEPKIISKPKTVSVKAVENNKKNSLYKVNTGKGDYFLIENRDPFSKNTYYDKSFMGNTIPMDSGLIITHVDESITADPENINNTVNWSTPEYLHYAVRILDNRPFYKGIYDERKIDAAFSSEDLQTELTPFSSYANTLSYFPKGFNISIKKISRSGNVMKAFISVKKKK